jgi:uncharacterized membrane protein
MLFAPEIRYQSLSPEQLQRLAEDLQQVIPAASVTPINKQARPTDWAHDDAVAFRLYDEDRAKPFVAAGLAGAVIAPEKASKESMVKAMHILSGLEAQNNDTLALGVVCTLGFLALIAYTLIERIIPDSLTLAGVFVSGLVLFFAGLTLLIVRSTKAPHRGRSGYALALLIPGLFMMAPLSMLNLPLLNYFKREQGQRLLQQSQMATD